MDDDRRSAYEANARSLQAIRQKRGLVKFSRLMAADTDDADGVDASKSVGDIRPGEFRDGFDIAKTRSALKTPVLSESQLKINQIDSILSRVNSILVQKQCAQSELDINAPSRRLNRPHVLLQQRTASLASDGSSQNARYAPFSRKYLHNAKGLNYLKMQQSMAQKHSRTDIGPALREHYYLPPQAAQSTDGLHASTLNHTTYDSAPSYSHRGCFVGRSHSTSITKPETKTCRSIVESTLKKYAGQSPERKSAEQAAKNVQFDLNAADTEQKKTTLVLKSKIHNYQRGSTSLGYASLNSKAFMGRKQSHQPGKYSAFDEHSYYTPAKHGGSGLLSASARQLQLDSKRSYPITGPGTQRDNKGKRQSTESVGSSKQPRYSKTKETTNSQAYGGSEMDDNRRDFIISETQEGIHTQRCAPMILDITDQRKVDMLTARQREQTKRCADTKRSSLTEECQLENSGQLGDESSRRPQGCP